MVTKKGWQEFRDTGLVVIVNQILHVFGWAIVFEIDPVDDMITAIYPARVKFRGFPENSTSIAYKKVSKYLKENAEKLNNEIEE